MISAKKLSENIRMKRKKMQEDGVENMVDTAAVPQMNPQDVLENKQSAQMQEAMDLPKKSMAPSDPADEDISGTDQDVSELKRRMAKVKAVFDKLG
jgi:hypothetical protein